MRSPPEEIKTGDPYQQMRRKRMAAARKRRERAYELHLQGKDLPEIAEILDKSLSTVRSYIERMTVAAGSKETK